MKRFILIITLVCFGYSVTSQTYSSSPKISSEYIKKHTAYFTIKNGKIQGKGKKVIKEMIDKSQFVTYGEMHNSKQTSKFIYALMPLLKRAGYQNFAIEVGPNSAEKLTELSTPASKTIDNLRTFNTKYTVKQGKQTAEPIPFFTAVSDAEFLKEARMNDMKLWGLDQEFYYASFFLIDELMKTVRNKSELAQLKQLESEAKQIMYKHFVEEAQKKNKGAYPLIVKEEAVTNFFNAFAKDNKEAQSIIKNLTLSWDIYIRWRNDSHADRISYMRNNFIANYEKALKIEKTPKVFTKIGSLHASKILSNGAYDIGNLTEEMAKKNGTISSTINTFIPYTKTAKGIVNNVERFKRSFKRYSLVTEFIEKDQGVIINLRKIREDILKGKIALPTNGDYHKLKSLIFGYDYQIMLPLDEAIVPNRDK